MTPSALLAGLAVALATAGLPDLLGRRRRGGRLPDLPGHRGLAGRLRARRGTDERPPPPPARRLAGLLARPGGLFERIGGRWRAAESAARLEAAGLDGQQAPQLAAVRGAAALAGLALAGVLAPGLPARSALLTLLAGPSAGFLGPDVWLRRRARERGRAIAGELADVLDLLRVAAGAGLSVRRALSEVARRHPGVLAAELGRAAACMSLGTPEDAALAALERRCPAAGVPALTAALARAQRFGAPLAGTLAAQAEQARARQAQRCAEAAARASPKIQLVVALLLVPSVLLLVAAALIPALVPS